MKQAYIDRKRAAAELARAGIDALVVLQPENFQYATGAVPGVAALFRRAGAAIALVPADEGLAPAAIVSDLFAPAFRASSDIADMRSHPIWVDTVDVAAQLPSNRPAAALIRDAHAAEGRAPGFKRPATFEFRNALAHLREALAERGLLEARLGIELDFLPVNDFATLKAMLPEASFVDSSAAIGQLRLVKSAREIALLQAGAAIAEAGIRHALADLREGIAREEIAERWFAGIRAEAKRRGVANMNNAWEYISVGPDPWGGGRRLARGDAIKVDVGCVLAGYSSDSGRTFVYGRASPHQREIYAALRAAFEAGRAVFRPGATLADVHRAATRAMREAGFADYDRGHFGHGIGQNVFSEEWPFIAADADVTLAPDMVLAFETPYYVKGIGGFIVEDQIRVTETGAVSMNTLPYELQEIG
jgi:Xaa-Pro aminopeptidase